MMCKRHDGVSLPELLGALVIFGLISALLGSITYVMVNAVNRIALAEKANAQALLVTGRLEQAMADAGGTAYAACVGVTDCVILENHYEYVYDALNDEIDLVVHAPALETTVSEHDGALWIDGVAIDAGDFTIAAATTLTVTDVAGAVTVTVAYVLVAPDGRTFAFNASYDFTTSDIPA
jgi:type II secretory pathway pseudopilin PulG